MAPNAASSQSNLKVALKEKDRKRKAAMLQRLAQEFRITVLDIVHEKGTGHWGGAASAAELLTVEEHTIHGVLGSAEAEVLSQRAPARMGMIGIQDTFAESGDYHALLRKYGISVERIESEAVWLLTPERQDFHVAT